MTDGVVSWSIERRGWVGSTMDIAAERAAAGAPEGTVVVADYQSDGRGRAGRRWEAPPGSALMLTAILRPDLPPNRLSPLALVAGVALAQAVEVETGLECWLKWPNDLWLGNRMEGQKAAGILVTVRLGNARVDHVLLGIGLNVSTPASALPEGATSIQVALEKVGGNLSFQVGRTAAEDLRERLLARTLDRLAEGYSTFVASRGRPPLDEWLRRAALHGERVEVAARGAPRRGLFVGVRTDGALLLRSDGGDEETVVAGDLVRGPRYSPTSTSDLPGR